MVSKREIIEYMRNCIGAIDVVLVDDLSSGVYQQRHVCGNSISVLQKNVFNCNIGNGVVIPIQYFYCNKCGKLIVDKYFM